MAIYQGNIFMYYPLLLIPAVYDIFDAEQAKERLRNIMLTLFNLAATSLTFIYFQFFSHVNFESADAAAGYLRDRTDIFVDPKVIEWELFRPVTYVYDFLNIPFLTGEEYPRERLIMTFIVLLPVLIILFAFYRKAVCCGNASGRSAFRMSYPYYVLMLMFIVPQFLLNVDWGRWLLATGILAFSEIFYLVYKKDSGILSGIDGLTLFLGNHKLAAALCLVYIAAQGNFLGRSFIPSVNSIIHRMAQSGMIHY